LQDGAAVCVDDEAHAPAIGIDRIGEEDLAIQAQRPGQPIALSGEATFNHARRRRLDIAEWSRAETKKLRLRGRAGRQSGDDRRGDQAQSTRSKYSHDALHAVPPRGAGPFIAATSMAIAARLRRFNYAAARATPRK
jgi:hypothetical protein